MRPMAKETHIKTDKNPLSAGVLGSYQDSIIGHKEAGQGAGYGSGTSLQTMASWMEKLDLSFLR